jgi:hypothetical protein
MHQVLCSHNKKLSHTHIHTQSMTSLDHMAVLFNFLRNLHTVSVMAILIYIPINSIQGSPFFTFSSTLVNVLTGQDATLWFQFTLPWWFLMRSIFSCICWPLLLRMSAYNLCPFGLQIFFPDHIGSLLTPFFLVWCNPYLSLLLSTFWCHIQKMTAQTGILEFFPHVFFF